MAYDDLTKMGGIQGTFLTTHWSLIQATAENKDQNQEKALINLLLNRYWKPVYCYLRRKGYNNEDAKDLTQGFFHEIILGYNIFKKADRSKGRFRSFLLKALERYLMTVHNKQTAQKRIPQDKLVSLEVADDAELRQVCTELTPEDSYNYAWVSALLERVLDDVRSDCYRDGLSVHWHVFHDRALNPIMNKTSPPSLKDVCHKYGVEAESTASNMIVTVKRRLGTTLRKHLRDSVESDDEVDEELQEIMKFLPKIAQDGA